MFVSPKINKRKIAKKRRSFRECLEKEIVRHFDLSKNDQSDKERFKELWHRESFLYKHGKDSQIFRYLSLCRERRRMYKNVLEKIIENRKPQIALMLYRA